MYRKHLFLCHFLRLHNFSIPTAVARTVCSSVARLHHWAESHL
jgi:hypothetical protein